MIMIVKVIRTIIVEEMKAAIIQLLLLWGITGLLFFAVAQSMCCSHTYIYTYYIWVSE